MNAVLIESFLPCHVVLDYAFVQGVERKLDQLQRRPPAGQRAEHIRWQMQHLLVMVVVSIGFRCFCMTDVFVLPMFCIADVLAKQFQSLLVEFPHPVLPLDVC